MHVYTASTSGDISLTAATAQTLLQLVTPSTRQAKVREIRVSFNSTTATDAPVLVQVVRQSTAGTSGATATPRPHNPNQPAALSTVNTSFSAEPTTSAVLFAERVPPQGGLLVYTPPAGAEWVLDVSSRIGVVLTAAQAQSGVRAELVVEE